MPWAAASGSATARPCLSMNPELFVSPALEATPLPVTFPGSAPQHPTATVPSTAPAVQGSCWDPQGPPPPSPPLPCSCALSEGHTEALAPGISCGRHTKLLLHTLPWMALVQPLSLSITPGAALALFLVLCSPLILISSSLTSCFSAFWLFFHPPAPGLILPSALKTQTPAHLRPDPCWDGFALGLTLAPAHPSSSAAMPSWFASAAKGPGDQVLCPATTTTVGTAGGDL